MSDFYKEPAGKALKHVMETLWQAGYEAYLAGGCVRDHLLNRVFNDFDIATSARPDDLEVLFPNHIPVGKQFGIIIVVVESFKFEIATFRSDGDYVDGRHPQGVQFTTAEEDAKRRDFTINALFYDLKKKQVIDFVGGREDLKSRVIRAVGDPNKRFSEDYLRMLRALRFRAQLQFEIEERTWLALTQNIKNLKAISGERISEELFKGFLADFNLMMESLESSGAWSVLFSNLGRRIKILTEVNSISKGMIQFKGEAFAFLILQSEELLKMECFGIEFNQKIIWSRHYENTITQINIILKLSRVDLKILKYLGAARSWIKYWQSLRPAFRYEILAMTENRFLVHLMLALGMDKDILLADLDHAQRQPKLFLTGVDVEKLDPQKRGSALKEIFYLQWEQKILSRTGALAWLKDNYLK